MATLTASQKTQIRNTIGDIDTTDPDISDARLQELYDDSADDLTLTMLNAAYERLGILSNQVDTTDANTLITERRKQRFEALEKIIERLERQADKSGGGITVGKLKLNINTKLSDIDGV